MLKQGYIIKSKVKANYKESLYIYNKNIFKNNNIIINKS